MLKLGRVLVGYGIGWVGRNLVDVADRLMLGGEPDDPPPDDDLGDEVEYDGNPVTDEAAAMLAVDEPTPVTFERPAPPLTGSIEARMAKARGD